MLKRGVGFHLHTGPTKEVELTLSPMGLEMPQKITQIIETERQSIHKRKKIDSFCNLRYGPFG
jgi:hypothetical protein